ncbi:hypothetical protein BGX34_000282 [Mortierella sp. NVP85]|nr:hypothetical protein BGX34_000282 [Mortierella sp. NVP85]
MDQATPSRPQTPSLQDSHTEEQQPLAQAPASDQLPQDNQHTDEVDADLLPVVRALYPFHSDDTTSLSFEKDELIQVLTQLESGWWYGYCRGERGWFPSNYVELLSQEEYDALVEEASDDDPASDDLWLPQTTADGQVFYYNTRTGESSWTIPASGDQKEGDEDEDTMDVNGSSRKDISDLDSNIDTAAQTESSNNEEVGQYANGVNIRTAMGRDLETESQSGSTRPSSWQTSAIPTRAGSPIQGPDLTLTGLRKPGWASPSFDDAENTPTLPPLPSVSNPFDPEPTWESLADHTTSALQNLLHSAENGYTAYYQIQATQVVEAIRLMLYASGTVDKDSEPIRLHRGLKIHHRQIMAALSKLVLSAKMASSFWPVEGAVTKMLADANDVAQAVHQFIFTAQSAGVPVHDVDAKLILDPVSPSESKSGKRLSRAISNASETVSETSDPAPAYRVSNSSSGLLNQLDDYTNGSCKALSVLVSQLKKTIETSQAQTPSTRLSVASTTLNSTQSSQLVNQCHQSISQLGSLLNLVGEFYTQTLNERPTIGDQFFINVRTSKQALYNNVAALVMAIQLATDPMVQTSVLEMALEATVTAEKSTVEMVDFTRALATEREQVEKTAGLQSKVDANRTLHPQRQSGIDSYFHGHGSDMEGDGAKSTRNRSNSSSSSTYSHSNISAPTTPGTEYTGRSQPNGYPFPLSVASSDLPQSPTLPTVTTPGGSSSQRLESRGEKLRKMLGDDAPAPKPKQADQPWFLGHDYSPADISINMEGHVRGGTLPALVERLTLHDGLDLNFVATFLLTYRSFTTTDQLFTLLFRRFTITPPQGLEPAEMDIWTEKKGTPVRLRVFSIIKSWIEHYYLEDEEEDRATLQRIKEFSNSSAVRDTLNFAAAQLIKLVDKRESSDGSFRRMVLNLTTQAPQPITPRNLKRIKFLDLDPLELARQLTIMEANYYNKIKPIECLAKAWTSENPELAAKAVNIKKMIETSNLYSNWINEIVLSEKETKKRAAIIKYLVVLAEKLRQLNNFSMLSATTAALSQSPIHRLKRTWELVPAKTMNALGALQALTSSAKNWADYRAELHSVNPPCVPFVGVYLTDLVMIEDGNPDFLRKTDNHINFYKRVSTAEVIREIQQYQSVPYCLTVVPEIQTFIRRGMDNAKVVLELYDMSLALEPR